MNDDELYERFGVRRTRTRPSARNDVPEGMIRITDVARVVLTYVTKHNDAYLIHHVGPGTEDTPDVENFDCAGSLRVAKRVARAAWDKDADHGTSGTEVRVSAFRWADKPFGIALEATVTSKWDHYDDEEPGVPELATMSEEAAS